MRRKALLRKALLATGVVGATLVWFPAPAQASTVTSAQASSFGVSLTVIGGSAVGPIPTVSSSVPPGDFDEDALLEVPPVAALGSVATAASTESTIEALDPDLQGLLYNAAGFAEVTRLSLLGVLTISFIQAEAVVACVDGQIFPGGDATFGVITVNRTVVPLDQLAEALAGALGALGILGVTVAVNNVSVTPNGAVSEALRVEVPGLLTLVASHAEASVGQCLPDADLPECSDGIDNDGDGLIDFPNDPGCDSPEDDDERNQCIDGIDNDGDGLIDFGRDPGCDSPEDNDERDVRAANILPRTGAESAGLPGLALLGLAAVALALRRRLSGAAGPGLA